MIGVSTLAAGLATAALLTVKAQAQTQTCDSYGIDFQDGGSYFQNISSDAPFTFVSIFEGCQADVAQNLLIDPNGDEYQCSDTNLTPDDVDQMSTCPLDKDQMYSGDWSVVIISNNGDADPIAYERDFYLTVGVPVTSTFTPTVTLSSTLTPIVNTTTTVPNIISATVNATVTDAAYTKHPTTTVTPTKVVIQTTQTMATIRKTAYVVQAVINEYTHTASCHVPRRQQHPDPTCSITPTLVSAAALSTSSSSAQKKAKKFRGGRRIVDREVPLDREQRIFERKARLAAGLQKRAPDNATVTVTDTNTDDYITTTFTSTAPASTLVITTATNTTTTLTNTFTTFSGITTVPRVTVTAPTPTSTHTKYTIATTTVKTKTFYETVNIWTTYVNPAASAICQAKGGKMV